ncbi:hypothetical protein [Enterococcus faecium]|uniref:hypothetical protein n=1 Tax=Enterococcus faecium TaxID=1352 RepID=UPI0034E96116
MSNLENKEEKVVNKIVSVVNKLDKELDELDTLSENPEKKHNLKKWLVERKAIHEIKKVLHEADKYEKYDEKELDKEFNRIRQKSPILYRWVMNAVRYEGYRW